jgi:signal peptidase I
MHTRPTVAAGNLRALWRIALTAAAAASLAGCAGAGVAAHGTSAAAVGPIQTFVMPSGSMLPTLKVGAQLQVDTGAYRSATPRIGDIVVMHPPLHAEQEVCGVGRPPRAACSTPEPLEGGELFVKRVVAGPGDRISIRKGHVYRNGKREADRYISPCLAGNSICDFPVSIRIPAGDWFVMGDNRGASDDSRFWGPIPLEWIVGNVLAARNP